MENDEVKAQRLLGELWEQNGRQGAEASGDRSGVLAELGDVVAALIAKAADARSSEVRALRAYEHLRTHLAKALRLVTPTNLSDEDMLARVCRATNYLRGRRQQPSGF